jgi:hypothetical protein
MAELIHAILVWNFWLLLQWHSVQLVLVDQPEK